MSDATMPPPGWYGDPARRKVLRWWDGSSWTPYFVVLPSRAPLPVWSRDMRMPRWRLAALAVALLLTAWTWSATLSDHSTWLRHRALYSRGITTTATVLSYHYDPEGGDPGGWTTDRVTFTTRQGQSITMSVGHHGPGPERATHAIDVTYDPVHPDVAIAANANVAPTDGSEWYGGLLLAFPSTFGAAALGAWAWRGRYRRKGRVAGFSE